MKAPSLRYHCPEASVVTSDQERWCTRCERTVHNISALTEAEAQALLAGQEGKICIQYARKRDGSVLFRSAALAALVFASAGAAAARPPTESQAPAAAANAALPPGMVEFTILDEAGRPAANAEVIVHLLDRSVVRHGRTGLDGKLVMSGLDTDQRWEWNSAGAVGELAAGSFRLGSDEGKRIEARLIAFDSFGGVY